MTRNKGLAMQPRVRVFVSYAREDAAFVDRLTHALGTRGIECWVDRREIAPAADWLHRIVDAIVNATFFVFVVSPQSVESEICTVELKQAVGLNKPIVPVVWRAAKIPEALKSVQWCDFSAADSFEEGVGKLEGALRRDPEWLADHARLAGSSADWDNRGRPWYNLLHGSEIQNAESWLTQANDTRPQPTALQLEYIRASRRFSTRWKLGALGSAALLVTIIIVTAILNQRSYSEAEARDLAARAVQLRTTDQSELEASTLMMVEAVRKLTDIGARSPDIEAMLRAGTRMLLRPLAAGIHPNGVGGMAVAPDGRLLATFAFAFNADVSALYGGRSDNTVYVWDVPSNTPAAILPHESPVGAASFDANGRLVTGTIKGSIEFWDLDSVRAGRTTPFVKYDQSAAITSIAGSDSLPVVVTANVSGTICAWDTTTGVNRWCRIGSPDEGRILSALSPDGKFAAAGDEHGVVKLWAVKDGKFLRSMQHASKGSITALVFSPGSNQIASGDEKGEMHVWSVPDGSAQFALSHRDAVREIAYTSKEARSSLIISVSSDRSLRLIDPRAFGTWRITEFKTDYALWHLALDPAGDLAAVARGDGFVDLWSTEEGLVVGRLHISSGDIATGLAFLPNNVLAIVDGGGGVQFAQTTAGHDSEFLNSSDGVDQMVLSSSEILLTSDFAGRGQAWDLSGGAAKRSSLKLPSFTQAAFSPQGERVALVDENEKVLRIVASQDARQIKNWPIPDNVGAVAWNPKRDVIAVAKRDGGLWLYDLNTGQEIKHASTGGNVLSFSPEGSRLAIVVPYSGLRVWDWNNNTSPSTPLNTGDTVAAVFSSSNLLLTASKNRMIRAIRIPSLAENTNFPQLWAAEFCPDDKHVGASSDGTLLAIACEDGRLRVWSVATGTIVSDLHYPGTPEAVAFTSDGRRLIVGGKSGLRGFVLSSADLIAESCLRLDHNFSRAEWARYIGTGRCRPICPERPACGNQ